jgi:hypothetical protein
MSVFLNINSSFLADKIHSANSKVIYASSGIDEVVASALINVSKKIGVESISVLLDVSENVMRYGYGNIEGVTLLNEYHIPIRDAEGLRIGALIYDDEGIIFTSTPLLIEAKKKRSTQPNAIKASPEQVQDIINALAPLDKDLNSPESNPAPEIGKVQTSVQQIKKVNNSIIDNPPQKFDVERSVQVYSTAIEFVELKLKGCEIQRHTVSIPVNLLIGKTDSITKKQLKAGFNIIEEGSSLSGDPIRNKLNELKKTYIKSIPIFGNVLLKRNKKEFDQHVEALKKDISEFKKQVEKELGDEIKKARDRLMKMLTPAITENPPDDLSLQIQGENPTSEQVEKYLKLNLDHIGE